METQTLDVDLVCAGCGAAFRGGRARALKAGCEVEQIDVLAVFEAADWTCGLCHEPVDRKLKWPNPLSANLDHRMPIALSGGHIRANVQLAHLRCNLVKSTSLPLEAVHS